MKKETTTALNAFRKRASEASLLNAQLSDLASTSSIDFAHYRSVLKNQQIVDEVEKAVKGFKPVTIDPAKEIKAIEAFEVKAVRRTLSPLFFGRGCGGSGVGEGREKDLEGVRAGGGGRSMGRKREPKMPPEKGHRN